MIYQNIEALIGNTPLLQISSKSHGLKNVDIYVKLEYLNPFGSIKDRTVLGLTKDIDFNKMTESGAQLIESSSGNTAKALQIIASRNGAQLTSVTNRVKVPEVDQMLRYIGTDIVSLPGRSECPDPNQEDNALNRIESMIQANPHAYIHTEQYTNQANPRVHADTTAYEIFQNIPKLDYVITSIGTGGSSGGIIDYIQNNGLATKTVGVVAHPSDFIPGIRTMNELFETPLFNKDLFESIEEVSSADALEALDTLVRNEGVLAGPTTGASFSALIKYLTPHDSLNPDGTRKSVAFIACDRLEPYMSYIVKRLPERFNANIQTDVFAVNDLSDDEKAAYELDANKTTHEWIKKNNVQIIDIRGVKPYQAFHINNSVSYPEEILREICQHATPFNAGKPLLFVCPRGDRSLLITAVLRGRGIEAYSLAGGLLAWRAAGLPFTRVGAS